MNRKRTTYNLIFGILSQVVSILLGAILPRLFLTNYGSEGGAAARAEESAKIGSQRMALLEAYGILSLKEE